VAQTPNVDGIRRKVGLSSRRPPPRYEAPESRSSTSRSNRGSGFPVKTIVLWFGVAMVIMTFANLCSNEGDSADNTATSHTQNSGVIGYTQGPIDGMVFVSVPAGEYYMGSPESDQEKYSNELPRQLVSISAFEIMTTEVTQRMWVEVMGSNPCTQQYGIGDDLPVYNVSWHDCREFISRLNSTSDGYTYRLPSEAEWEYSARAGGSSTRYWGVATEDYIVAQFCVYAGNSNKPSQVGSRHPNAWGLFDVLGNVYEWCEDVYVNNYHSLPEDGSPYTGNGTYSNNRVIRGGSWSRDIRNCRSADRTSADPASVSSDRGFRLVRTDS